MRRPAGLRAPSGLHRPCGAVLLERLEREAESHADPVDIPQRTPDPKDDYLVALYREADADAPITGDADFANLTGEFVVMTPAEMLAQL